MLVLSEKLILLNDDSIRIIGEKVVTVDIKCTELKSNL
jgi:hypothetical protein